MADPSTLRLQLVPHASRSDAALIQRYQAFDLILVSSTDDGPESVRSTDLASYGLSLRGAFRPAMDATFKQELAKLDVRDFSLGDGRSFKVAAIDECPYVTVALLVPKVWAGTSAEAGAFVCAPAFSSVAVLNVATRKDGHLAKDLERICASMNPPDACDPRVYWWDGYVFHRPKYVAQAGTGASAVVSPSGLTRALSRLPDSVAG